MKQIAIIKHMYLFEPSSTWQNGSAFEKDLSDFFAAHGYQAELIETKGNATERIMYIQKIEESTPKLDNKKEEGKKDILKEGKDREVPKSFKRFSSKPILKGVIPTKPGPQPKLRNFYQMKFKPNKPHEGFKGD